jgi:hypothetical protein
VCGDAGGGRSDACGRVRGRCSARCELGRDGAGGGLPISKCGLSAIVAGRVGRRGDDRDPAGLGGECFDTVARVRDGGVTIAACTEDNGGMVASRPARHWELKTAVDIQ